MVLLLDKFIAFDVLSTALGSPLVPSLSFSYKSSCLGDPFPEVLGSLVVYPLHMVW